MSFPIGFWIQAVERRRTSLKVGVDFLKKWDISEAERELKLFEEQIKRAKSMDLTETDVVQKRHGEFKLQNDKYARNAHQAKTIAMRLIDGDGNLVLDNDDWNALPMYSGNDVQSFMYEIRTGNHKQLPQSEHALTMLLKLKNDEELREKLKAINKPGD